MIQTTTFLVLPLLLTAATPSFRAAVRPALPLRMIPLAVMALGIVLLDWLDPFHLSIACVTAMIIMISRNAPKSRLAGRTHQGRLQRDTVGIGDWDVPERKPLATELGRALARGFLFLLIFVLASLLLSLIPGLDTLAFDRDRTELELKLDALEQAGDCSAAAELIVARLERRTSRQWREMLTGRLYESLIGAGKNTSGEQAEAFFLRALDLADQNGLDNQLAKTHLDRLSLRGVVDRQSKAASDLAQMDQKRQEEIGRLTSQIGDTQRERDQLGENLAAARLETKGLQQNLTQAQADRRKTLEENARATVGLLVGWADSLEAANPLRRAKYQEAEAISQKYGLPTALVATRLTDLEQALARQQPAPLPAGTEVTINRIDRATVPPLTIVDLTVGLQSGKPLTDLAAKDFRLQLKNETIASPIAVISGMVTPQATQIVLLFDRSNSTGGPALAAAKAGGTAILNQLQGIACVKLMSFGDRVSVVSDWTDDLVAAAGQLETLATAGNTALFQALGQAIGELEGRGAPKAIILFTDGRDTVGGPSMADLAALAQKAAIVVHAIALETAELERDLLAQITLASGGLLLPADNVEELPQRFRQAAEALQRPFYRLVFSNRFTEPCEIVVGGTNAVHVNLRTTEATTTTPAPQNRR